MVWDNDAYSFLSGPAPTSVHPSLWRQSRLAAKQGLFEVVPGIYQVRGFDISNISFVEGDTGTIVIDPLVSTEVAAAALDLYRTHRGGDRPVVAVIYTHSHVDHFGGVLGVTTQADVDAGKVSVLAPEGFTAHAVQENIYAGGAMMRRAGYMYGSYLPRGPRGRSAAVWGRHFRPVRCRSSCRPSTSGRPARYTPSTGWRSSSRWRRAAKPPPKCTSISRASARCAWPRTPPTTCTTC
ncbi:metallo-beta-lactamase superfamily protein [Mycobacterium kansasii]|uniref:Metallo-beta-lactamase superfamily protein n=1 Tax=Mycobacterium kansasii TaxID=1768 RepID=A0A1V3XA10_MYCKA|nr:metallo-beta-lactamase superfamily protein [Mycobacterium kansasii]